MACTCEGVCTHSCPGFQESCPANATAFTNDPVIAGVTNIRAVHINELRVAVLAELTRRSMGLPSFGSDVTVLDNVIDTHFTLLKTSINNMVAEGGDGVTVSITDTYVVGQNIRGIHMNNLRDKVQELEVDCSCDSLCPGVSVCGCFGQCSCISY